MTSARVTDQVASSAAAYIVAETGAVVTHAALEATANQVARAIQQLPLQRGDRVALLLGNHAQFLPSCWGVQRAGLQPVLVDVRLPPEQLCKVLAECAAQALLCTSALAERARKAMAQMPLLKVACAIDGAAAGMLDFAALIASCSGAPLVKTPQPMPMPLFFTAGVSASPKAVQWAHDDDSLDRARQAATLLQLEAGEATGRMLVVGALSQAFIFTLCEGAMRRGVTLVITTSFAAGAVLECIDRFRITHCLCTPNLFTQLLELPVSVRRSYDMSPLRQVLHGLGSCPEVVKRAMIDWWGGILHEFYAGTEVCAHVHLNSSEWLAHPGAVGRVRPAEVQLFDPQGQPVPALRTGLIHFADAQGFVYDNDSTATANARLAGGWTTLGDLGYVDNDGYLYLVEHRDCAVTIGANTVYPREAEAILCGHPNVLEAAVVAVEDAASGGALQALVRVSDGVVANALLELALLDYCRARLSAIKCPVRVEFCDALPRHVDGQLRKAELIRARG